MMHKASNIRGEAELREFGVVPHLALHARTNSNKSSVLECFTVNPKHESPTGLRGRVRKEYFGRQYDVYPPALGPPERGHD